METYAAYCAYDADIRNDGIHLVPVGDVPFYEFLQKLAGYREGFYQLYDCPDEVEHLLKIMISVQKERLWPVIMKSPAPFVQHGIHFSSVTAK